MNTIKAAVFASGTGSNFQALIEQADLPCEIVLLVCDRPNAPVIDKAKQKGIAVHIFNPKDYQSKGEYEKELVSELKRYQIEWLFLAGYMRLVGRDLLEAYSERILNIHPSLLPDFPGLDAIGQALEAGVSETGVTVHYVDAGMDTGPIIMQETVRILEEDTSESLAERIHTIEHRLYVQAIKHVIKGVQ